MKYKLYSHVLAALVVTGLILPSAKGTVVFGDLRDGTLGSSLNATLVFTPLLTPMGVGAAQYLDISKKTNVVGGVWSMNLVGGLYTVQAIPYGRKMTIFVPINGNRAISFNTVSDITMMTGVQTNMYSYTGISINTNALLYIQDKHITSSDAIDRINWFYQSMQDFGLYDSMVDGAALAVDLNDQTAPGSFNHRLIVNSATPKATTEGYVFDGTWSSTVPITTTSWDGTLVVMLAGRTNAWSAGWHIPAGVYSSDDSQRSYFAGFNGDLGLGIDGSRLSYGGQAYEPWNHYPQFYDERERFVAIYQNGTTNQTMWCDGVAVLTNANYYGSYFSLSPSPAKVVIGQSVTNNFGSLCTVRAWAYFNRALSTNDHVNVMKAFRQLHPSKENYIFYGDSLTALSTFGGNIIPNYPFQLMTSAGWTNNRPFWVNVAQGGQLAASMAFTSWMGQRVCPYAPYGRVNKSTLFIQAGINDCSVGDTVAHIDGYLKSIWAQAAATNINVNAFTLSIADPAWSGYTLTLNPTRVLVNSNIINSASFYDRLIDRDLLFTAKEMAPNCGYTVDGIHLTALGNQRQAMQIKGLINVSRGTSTNGAYLDSSGNLTLGTIMPVGQTNIAWTNLTSFILWNSNNMGLYLRWTNGIDKQLISWP